MDDMKMYCACCPTKEDCRHAFGKFWRIKSRNGTGCETPFAYGGLPVAMPKRPVRRIKTKGDDDDGK